ncbi:winged helix-turn-helix domain-containing protein [Pseudotabrizicola sediminis]|uniref:winged helix-turn-helix domain-containing protein n=1 Tax=Pseudotabrizicola sediminis TaxID=2486418 RepID=UPI001436B09A|nr:winged helix-turn-helix domain-containing protein [Pseudotabrizicola sediminis]
MKPVLLTQQVSDGSPRAVVILPSERAVRIDGETRQIGARAFDVLAYLHSNTGRVVTKAELLENVWVDLNVEESNLTVQIAALRKLIGARAIATVPGVGYQLTLSAKAPAEPPKALPLPDKPSLAVLPFANLTGDAGKDYLVDGIVADLIAALSRIPVFFVIAASSTFTLKGRSVDLAEVGRQLGVRYLLEGSIQSAGDRLRINTQLVEAETGRMIWSNRFSGTLAEIFELQDAVTVEVAAAIEPNVILAEARRASAKPTTDLSAYDLCLQAMPMAHRLPDFASFVAARTLLERALALDPGYAHAKALICRLTEAARSERWLSLEEAAGCLPLAEEVVVDPCNDAMALAFAGITIAFLGKQQQRGLHILRQAYALNPNSSHVLYASGWVHNYVGDSATAIDHFNRAIRINPLDPMLGQIRSGLGAALLMSGRVKGSVATLEQALVEAPEYTASWLTLAIGYWELGLADEARHFGQKLLARDPSMTISKYIRDLPVTTPEMLGRMECGLRGIGIPE